MRGARQGMRFELTLEQQQMTAHGHEHAEQKSSQQGHDGDVVFRGQLGINTFHFYSDFSVLRQSLCHWQVIDYQRLVNGGFSQNGTGRFFWEDGGQEIKRRSQKY